MDERQQQIREGAGLEESKYNVEFIEFLQKWSTPILLLVAVAALAMVVWKRVEKARIDKINVAFTELATATETANANPEALKGLAETYEGVRSVASLARTDAADQYLRAVRTGMKPGAKLNPDGSIAPEDALSDDERTRLLGEAERLYTEVLNKNRGDASKSLLSIGSLYGLASVAECRGQFDVAKGFYEQVVTLAESAGFTEHALAAKKRIEDSAKFVEVPKLYIAADLPKPPPPPAPPAPTGVTGSTGAQPATGPEAATGATGTPAPTGAPAPSQPGATGPAGTAPPTGAPAATGSPAPAPTGVPAATGTPAAPPANPK
jgi:hypothetical protein